MPARTSAALAAFAALAVAAWAPRAGASPPVPLFSRLDDLARAQVVAGGAATATPETDTAVATYALPAGAGSGWRTAPGTAIVAVTEGTLTLAFGKGCATRQLAAGQAAVVPAGRFLVANAAAGPAEFAGVFLGLGPGAPRPLDGAPGAPPAGCSPGAGGATMAAANDARATMIPISPYGVAVPKKGEANRVVAQPAKDVLVASYELQPKFSTGWVTHAPAYTIVTRGTMTYYEGQAGVCIVAGEYSAGQGYFHPGTLHLATNEGPAVVALTVVYLNVPHGGAGPVVPVLGNTLDANDFSPLPPRDCPSIS